MQVVKNILFSLLVVWFALLLFMPKEALYFTLEKALFTEGIEINEKEMVPSIFSLNIKDATIYYHGIEIASVEEIDFFTLLLFSKVELKGLKTEESLKKFVPEVLTKTTLIHSVLSPFEAFITSFGSFGAAEGVADLKNSTVRINIVDEKELGVLKSQMKKDAKGWYYETSF